MNVKSSALSPATKPETPAKPNPALTRELKHAATANRDDIARDDWHAKGMFGSQEIRKRDVEVGGQTFTVVTQGTLEGGARRTGQHLTLDQTLTRAGYDVATLSHDQKLKLLDALNRTTERQVGRETAKFLHEVAQEGRNGTFHHSLLAANGQRYVLTAHAELHDVVATRTDGGQRVWADWKDTSKAPEFAEPADQGDRHHGSPGDALLQRANDAERRHLLDPLVKALKLQAVFGDGDAKTRQYVEGAGVWDAHVEVEHLSFTAKRMQPSLYDGGPADFLGQLVRAQRANDGEDVRGGQAFQDLRAQLASPDWAPLRNFLKTSVMPGLSAQPTEAELQAAFAALPPERRRGLRTIEDAFFKAEIGAQELLMKADAVDQDKTKVERDFIFADRKIHLKLELETDVSLHKYKPPLFDRILQFAGLAASFLGGFIVAAAPAAAAVVGATQAGIGAIQALRGGDFKGFALNLLSAVGSGAFGTGSFQNFAKTASTIGSGVDGLLHGKNFFDKLGAVAQLAGGSLDTKAAQKWGDELKLLSRLTGIGSAILEKDGLGLFTASMAVVSDAVGAGAQYERARAEQLKQMVHGASIRPLSAEEAQQMLHSADALNQAIDAGLISVQGEQGSWKKVTQGVKASLANQYGSFDAAVKSGKVKLGVKIIPDGILGSSGAGKPGPLAHKPVAGEGGKWPFPKPVAGAALKSPQGKPGSMLPIDFSRGSASSFAISSLGDAQRTLAQGGYYPDRSALRAWLAQSGASPDQAQQILRQNDANIARAASSIRSTLNNPGEAYYGNLSDLISPLVQAGAFTQTEAQQMLDRNWLRWAHAQIASGSPTAPTAQQVNDAGYLMIRRGNATPQQIQDLKNLINGHAAPAQDASSLVSGINSQVGTVSGEAGAVLTGEQLRFAGQLEDVTARLSGAERNLTAIQSAREGALETLQRLQRLMLDPRMRADPRRVREMNRSYRATQELLAEQERLLPGAQAAVNDLRGEMQGLIRTSGHLGNVSAALSALGALSTGVNSYLNGPGATRFDRLQTALINALGVYQFGNLFAATPQGAAIGVVDAFTGGNLSNTFIGDLTTASTIIQAVTSGDTRGLENLARQYRNGDYGVFIQTGSIVTDAVAASRNPARREQFVADCQRGRYGPLARLAANFGEGLANLVFGGH